MPEKRVSLSTVLLTNSRATSRALGTGAFGGPCLPTAWWLPVSAPSPLSSRPHTLSALQSSPAPPFSSRAPCFCHQGVQQLSFSVAQGLASAEAAQAEASILVHPWPPGARRHHGPDFRCLLVRARRPKLQHGSTNPGSSASSRHASPRAAGRRASKDLISHATKYGFDDLGSSCGNSMKSGRSQSPYKKAAVTSSNMTFSFPFDDLHVAALEIRLLAIARPGVPEKRVSLSKALLGNSRATSRALGTGAFGVPLLVRTHFTRSIVAPGVCSTSLFTTCREHLISCQFRRNLFRSLFLPPRRPVVVPLGCDMIGLH